jgi:crotonobetainyl-CoA:carnitine CoA-transferase CaiB-like acyl-CoA transferase
MTTLPLEGIRVIELTTGAAGPTVARVLCEFGAEVIRCETRLRGDGHRGEDPKLWNKKPDFMKLQRGKKSFTVNMQTPMCWWKTSAWASWKNGAWIGRNSRTSIRVAF